jgi:dTDP-4-amino-4,6-dideoxygalactose transaminase
VFPPADRAEIAAAVTEILASGALTLGPYTGRFEAAFAAAHDAAHAVATSSGTSALNIALQVAGVAGRDVVVPAAARCSPTWNWARSRSAGPPWRPR